MSSGKVLNLYMTMPDLMRSGHRQKVEDFECDPNGIIGDKDYEGEGENLMLLVSQKSYEIIEEAELVLDQGVLMENIYVDVDLYHLQKGSVIEIGETIFEVTGPCRAYGYLYAFAPELPELIDGKRGLFIKAVDYGRVAVGDEVNVLEAVTE
jgi:MOSC domain-containing protein YiiM